MLEAIERLHYTGHVVDVDKVNNSSGDGLDRPAILANLSEYPFDHSRIIWTESRLSRAFRFRKEARLDLLATPEIDWNRKRRSGGMSSRSRSFLGSRITREFSNTPDIIWLY